jgi:hypothetical protein
LVSKDFSFFYNPDQSTIDLQWNLIP